MNRVIMIAFVVVSSFASTVSAGFILAFSADGSSTTINRPAGEPTELSIYIRQTNGETRLSDSGLIGFAFRLTFDETRLTFQSGQISPDFNVLPEVRTAPGQVDFLGGAAGTIPTAINDSLLLSKLTVTGISEGIAPLEIKYLPNSLSEFTLNDANFTEIQGQIFGANLTLGYSQNFNISSVPEPSSLWMTGIVFAVLQGIRFARRKSTIGPYITQE